VPAVLLFLGLVVQNFGLYIATHYYIVWMDRLHDRLANTAVSHDAESGRTVWAWEQEHVDLNRTAYSSKLGKEKLDPEEESKRVADLEELSTKIWDGSLHDLFAAWLGSRMAVPTSTLDLLAGVLPPMMLFFSVGTGNLCLWTRCCLCGTLLAVMKGFFGAATVVPDSIGWTGCKARLGEDGLNFFRSIDFDDSYVSSLLSLLKLEIFGVKVKGGYQHLRFCADMMFSGHTYMCSIFALGLYDMSRTSTAQMRPELRFICRLLLAAILVAIVCADVVLIILNRFHYSTDVAMALVLCLLLFSNPAIAIASEWWTQRARDAEGFGFVVDRYGEDEGSIVVPPCCLPLCCFQGRYHMRRVPDLQNRFLDDLKALETAHNNEVQELRARADTAEVAKRGLEEECHRLKKELELSRRKAGPQPEPLPEPRKSQDSVTNTNSDSPAAGL